MNKKIIVAILFCCQICLTGIPVFAAQNYDIKQMTPEVEQALNSRKARYEELQSLKSQGLVGEDSQGFVQSMSGASSGAIVASENRDRKIIYQAIVDQNNLGAGGMAQVKLVFGDVQREKARSGDLIQLPSGEWIKK
jgi:uncharacterized protein YdbL (DUF1318 family)